MRSIKEADTVCTGKGFEMQNEGERSRRKGKTGMGRGGFDRC
jgi:hypothetical protein